MQRRPSLTTGRALAAIVLVHGLGFPPDTAGAEPVRLAFVRVPARADGSAGRDIGNTILAGRYPAGARIMVARLQDPAGTMRAVTDGFASAADPTFSHDGTRMAFSGQRSVRGPLQIWELLRDTPRPRQLVACEADCVSPVYMPNGHVVFASLLSMEYEEHGGRYSFSLYEWAPGREGPTRLTFNPSSDFDPAVLPDGRIVYSSWQHVGTHHWPRGNVALMLINADGTGVFPLTGNHRGPWLKAGATPLGDDRVAFIESDQFRGFGDGTLTGTSLNDAFAPYTTLVSGAEYHVAGAAPLPGGAILLSARPADGSRPTFGLYVLDAGRVTLLYDDPVAHELAPAVGADTPRPQRRISTVVPGTPFGYALVLNCYETDRRDQHRLAPGGVKAVRVLEGLPLRHNGTTGLDFLSVPGREREPLVGPDSATGYIPVRVLGEVPPAADGSVYLKLPADRPLRLQLVDHDGFTIIDERSWFWLRPNERRTCIGCHENRELSPANATPLAARGSPADLTDAAGWRTVSFRRDILPILNANCATSYCHVPPDPTAAMNLSSDPGRNDAVLADRFGPAYANLLQRQEGKPFSVGGRRVHPGDSRQSPLMWWLCGRELGKQYDAAPFERPILEPHLDPPLAPEQLDLLRLWIDLGAPYDGEPAPGPWPWTAAAASTTEVTRDVD